LVDCPSLLEVLKLSTVPPYTTLQKATRRLLAATPACGSAQERGN